MASGNVSNVSVDDVTVDEPYWTIDRINFAFGVAYIPLILSSLFGNVVIVIIMMDRKERGSSTGVLFSALAVCDIIVTIIGPLKYAVLDTVKAEIVNNLAFFEANQLLFLIFQTASAWLLVGITFERFMVTMYPLASKTLLTARFAIIEVIVIYLVVIAIQVGRLYGYIVFVYLPQYQTYVLRNKVAGGRPPYFWSGVFVSFLGPFAAILIGSVFIVIKIRKTVTGRTSDNASKRVLSVTRNLLAANIAFFLTSLPWYIINFLGFYDFLIGMGGPERILMVNTLRYVLLVNQALNFYVYVISGQKFRQDAWQLFAELCKKG